MQICLEKAVPEKHENTLFDVVLAGYNLSTPRLSLWALLAICYHQIILKLGDNEMACVLENIEDE